MCVVHGAEIARLVVRGRSEPYARRVRYAGWRMQVSAQYRLLQLELITIERNKFSDTFTIFHINATLPQSFRYDFDFVWQPSPLHPAPSGPAIVVHLIQADFLLCICSNDFHLKMWNLSVCRSLAPICVPIFLPFRPDRTCTVPDKMLFMVSKTTNIKWNQVKNRILSLKLIKLDGKNCRHVYEPIEWPSEMDADIECGDCGKVRANKPSNDSHHSTSGRK